MENNNNKISNVELIGRVLDNKATCKERMMVICNMQNISFKECFTIAYKAQTLFNEKNRTYETVQ